MDFYNNDIKPYLCSFATVALGVLYVSPILEPKLANLPLLGGLSSPVKQALLAGAYGASANSLCNLFKAYI
jgi:hypothetical protein